MSVGMQKRQTKRKNEHNIDEYGNCRVETKSVWGKECIWMVKKQQILIRLQQEWYESLSVYWRKETRYMLIWKTDENCLCAMTEQEIWRPSKNSSYLCSETFVSLLFIFLWLRCCNFGKNKSFFLFSMSIFIDKISFIVDIYKG